MDFLVISYLWHCSLDNLSNNFQFPFFAFPLIFKYSIPLCHRGALHIELYFSHGCAFSSNFDDAWCLQLFVLFNEVDALKMCRIFFFLVVWKRLDFFAMSIKVPSSYLLKAAVIVHKLQSSCFCISK